MSTFRCWLWCAVDRLYRLMNAFMFYWLWCAVDSWSTDECIYVLLTLMCCRQLIDRWMQLCTIDFDVLQIATQLMSAFRCSLTPCWSTWLSEPPPARCMQFTSLSPTLPRLDSLQRYLRRDWRQQGWVALILPWQLCSETISTFPTSVGMGLCSVFHPQHRPLPPQTAAHQESLLSNDDVCDRCISTQFWQEQSPIVSVFSASTSC